LPFSSACRLGRNWHQGPRAPLEEVAPDPSLAVANRHGHLIGDSPTLERDRELGDLVGLEVALDPPRLPDGAADAAEGLGRLAAGRRHLARILEQVDERR